MKSKNLLRGIVQSLSTFVLLLFFAVSVFAQQGTSTVRGTVKIHKATSSSGATVTLTNLATGATRTTTTTTLDGYVFDFIRPGWRL